MSSFTGPESSRRFFSSLKRVFFVELELDFDLALHCGIVGSRVGKKKAAKDWF